MVDSQSRKTALMRDMAIRLRPVCADWPDDLFNTMIERLADVTLKFEGTSSPSTYDRRSTDRLVDELREALERNDEVKGERPETE